jgi:solute:Na+ symporter, SSS family
MPINIIIILAIIGLYMLACLFLGILSYSRAKSTVEDYLMGSREFQFFSLFCAVYATNISAVALIGGPGLAYHVGWVSWAYFASAWAWLSPILFYTIGHKSWVLGKRFGVMTISDLFYERWQSNFLRYLSSALLLFYVIPYVMIGFIGGGRTFFGLTSGYIPYWLGAFITMAIVTLYVAYGGMRGTVWTHILETLVFVIGATIIFFFVAGIFGGFASVTEQVAAKYPELLNRSKMSTSLFFSYGVIVSLAVPMFPQVYVRLLIGREPKALKKTILLYPLAGLLIWFFMAYLGMWGHLIVPNLKGAASDNILPMLLAKTAPAWVAGILGATIFAANMSTVDAQLLTTGTMFTRDFFFPMRKGKPIEKRDVALSRALVILFSIVAFIAALIQPAGIIKIIEWSFGGFACMVIPMLAALYWKRCNKWGALASIIVSQFISITLPIGLLPKSIAFGMLPGIPSLIGGLVALVVVTYLTAAPQKDANDRFFGALNKG